MLTEIGSLVPGDTYSNGSYKVWKKSDTEITVVRKPDNWLIKFTADMPNWKHKVKKDENNAPHER